MGRRSPGDGAIERAGNGWRAVVELPAGPDGRRRRKKRRARTKTEATHLLREMQREFHTSGRFDDGQRTVADAVADYLQVRANRGLAESTVELDRWMASVIVGSLGRRRTVALTVQDCDRFLDAASSGDLVIAGNPRQPIRRTALRRVRSTLVGSLRNEMRLGLLNRNVAELSVLPADSSTGKGRRALTIDELHRLCAAARGATSILVDLVGRNGLRPAEARAVRWSNVDLVELLLMVDSQMAGNDTFTKPKTRKAYRTIRIDETTARKLADWRAVQADQRSYAGPAWHDLDVVAAAASGRPIQRNNFRRSIVSLCHRIGIDPPIAPYELRHTAISIQAEAGHSAWQIADWAGTSERMITEVYRHKLSSVAPLGPVE
jgi:integrase